MHADPAKARKLLNALGSSLSALRGLRFSAPAKEMSQKTESPFVQSSQSGLAQSGAVSSTMAPASPDRNRFGGEKVGRNDLCPCGAKHPDGRPKKFKQCHGK